MKAISNTTTPATTYTAIAVHGGIFHADDVMCVAIMREVNPSIEVLRVFKTDGLDEEKVLVADIGGGAFDHHQTDAKVWSDGRKAAAAGLVFEAFGRDLFPTEKAAEVFYKEIIAPIEDQDNGGEKNPLSTAISVLNPNWNEDGSPEAQMTCFMQAVDMLQDVLRSYIRRAQAQVAADALGAEAVAKAEANKGIAVLEQFFPWQAYLAGKARFCVFPSNRGGWNIQTVPSAPGGRDAMEAMPAIEVGKGGCTFVHPARFIAAFDSKESALAALGL